MKKRILIVLSWLLISVAAFSQQLKPHTEFRVKLTGRLSTAGNQKGDKLAAQVVSPKPFAGAIMEGQITESKGKGVLRRGSALNFTFNSLHICSLPSKRGPCPVAMIRVIAINSDVKSFGNSKGIKNVDDQDAAVEHTSDATAANPQLASVSPKEAPTQTKDSGVTTVVVQMTSKEKHISFAPGSEFILDVSPLEDNAGNPTGKK